MDGSLLEPKTKVFPDDEFMIDLERPSFSPIEPYDYPLKILHEDDSLLVVNKDSGMVTHPGDGTSADTLVHALMHHCPDQLCPVGAPERPGIVHRLDKETSGGYGHCQDREGLPLLSISVFRPYNQEKVPSFGSRAHE